MAVVTIDAEQYKAAFCPLCRRQHHLEEMSSEVVRSCSCNARSELWKCWVIVVLCDRKRWFIRGRMWRIGAATFNRS